MLTYAAGELKEILDNHRRWIYSLEGKQERANLRGANLSDADLRGADLGYANLSDADLGYANLSEANLSDADLSDADLGYANLSEANLSNTNLRGATLSNANLRGANLRGADLRGANLSNANLRDICGNLHHVKSLQTEKYYITYTSKVIQIGCQRHNIEEWRNFDDETIKQMDGATLMWWKKWKPIIMQIIEMAPCEETRYEETL